MPRSNEQQATHDLCIQKITELYEDDHSRKEIVSILVDDFGVSERSAYNYFREFISTLDEPWDNGTKRQLRADAEEVLRDQLEAAKCGDTTVLNKDLQDLCFNVLKAHKTMTTVPPLSDNVREFLGTIEAALDYADLNLGVNFGMDFTDPHPEFGIGAMFCQLDVQRSRCFTRTSQGNLGGSRHRWPVRLE